MENGERGSISVLRAPAPGHIRFAVDGIKQRPETAVAAATRLARLPGVERAEANALTGHVLVRFDIGRWSAESLLDASGQALGLEPLTSPDGANGGPRSQPAGLRALPAATATGPSNGALQVAQAEPEEPWHARDIPDVVAELEADAVAGLSDAAAAERRARVGPNAMPQPREVTLGELVVHQLANAPTALLGVSAGISLLTGGLLPAGLMVSVIAINAAIGALTERHGNRAIAALRGGSNVSARVVREGIGRLVDASELVPGDVIVLSVGDAIPADARLLEVDALAIEESALTGESQGVEKDVASVPLDAVLADRRSMVYRGTTVVAGRGRALVVETGTRTVLGRLHLLAAQAESPPTPIERELGRLGRLLAIGVGAITIGVTVLSIWRGAPLLLALQVSISLAVAAIPEGMTALATSVLALASGRLRKEGTLIRTLGAAEALGAVTVVCADKTGTITENRMAASELYAGGARIVIRSIEYGKVGSLETQNGPLDLNGNAAAREALTVGVLCSDAEPRLESDGRFEVDGSATEAALQEAAALAGLEPWILRPAHPHAQVRYRAEGRRHMVTTHEMNGEHVALMKGAPEEVLALCGRVCDEHGERDLDARARAEIGRVNADMAGRAMRVLGLARRKLDNGTGVENIEQVDSGFTFLGLIGLIDPVRPSAAAAVAALRGAGIRTVMITGDQGLTAMAVAREIGLAENETLRVLEAGDLAALGPEAISALVKDVHVFARISPEMKLAIVRALQMNGEIVAMSGDGVNDGPALRAANVGIAMGERGTELARELADVVLSRDDLSLIADAVEEGRLVRANVRRVLHYLLTTNMSEVALVSSSVALGWGDPLTPLQLLWLNVVTDLAPGLGLAVEPREPRLMNRPPEDPQQPILTREQMRMMAVESSLITLTSLGAYRLALASYGPGAVAGTIVFAALMNAQLLHVQMARVGTRPFVGAPRPRNTALQIGTMASAVLGSVALFAPPLRAMLGGAPLGGAALVLATAGGILPIVAIEVYRQLHSRFGFFGSRSPEAPTTAKGAPQLG